MAKQSEWPPRPAGRRPLSDRQRVDATEPIVGYMVHTEDFALETAIQMAYVQGHAGNVRDQARQMLGDRFAGLYLRHDGHIVILAVSYAEADDAVAGDIARLVDAAGWVHVLPAERSEAQLLRFRDEVSKFILRRPAAHFSWTMSPSVRTGLVTLRMGADEAQQELAAALQAEFVGRELVIEMKPGYGVRRPRQRADEVRRFQALPDSVDPESVARPGHVLPPTRRRRPRKSTPPSSRTSPRSAAFPSTRSARSATTSTSASALCSTNWLRHPSRSRLRKRLTKDHSICGGVSESGSVCSPGGTPAAPSPFRPAGEPGGRAPPTLRDPTSR